MIVKCPTCKNPVEWSDKSPFKPFCSKRCRLIDLGAWADGSYAISDTQSDNTQELDQSQSEDEDHNH